MINQCFKELTVDIFHINPDLTICIIINQCILIKLTS